MGTDYKYKMCGCFPRSFGVAEPPPPEEVKRLFEKYAGEGGAYMSPEHLRRFLEAEQAATTEESPEKIVERVMKEYRHIGQITRNALSLEDFFYYLFSVHLNPPFEPNKVHQDMKAPLSHYFIFTGHNSYLTENQLSSKSSDIPIKMALEGGVRGIELDLWPNSYKDKILVRHGGTLTTSADLLKCLNTIKEHAFVRSDYPVIITLEDHLNPKLQDEAKEMITQTFGNEMLYYPESDDQTEFPSLKNLKKKILISTKPPKEYPEAAQDQFDTNVCFNFVPRKLKDTRVEEHVSDDPNYSDFDQVSQYSHEDEEHEPYEYDCELVSEHLEALTYKDLIAIQARKKFELENALQIDPDKVWRVSLNEEQLKRLTSLHENQVVRFTQKNILSIYPKGARVDSSNYNPFVGWMHGAQTVAFNMQRHDRWLEVMCGMFRANGGCGYVKKPAFQMNEDHIFDPKTKLPTKKTLKVNVYMGDGWRKDFKKTYFDKCSPPDFYTKVRVIEPVDGERKRTRSWHTKVEKDKWIPVWNEEFNFPLKVPGLAVLEIRVYEHDNGKDDFAGQTCLPVSELKDGIRAIPLYSRKGDRDTFKSVKLLVGFKFEDLFAV